MRLEPRNDGSFLFPPASYANAGEFASFWANVPIGDEVLAKITAGYARLILQQRSALEQRWRLASAKDLECKPDAVSMYKRSLKAVTVHTTAFDEMHPRRIEAHEARAIALAGQMHYYSSVVGKEVGASAAFIGDLTLRIGGKEMSVKNIAELYQVGELRPCFEGA